MDLVIYIRIFPDFHFCFSNSHLTNKHNYTKQEYLLIFALIREKHIYCIDLLYKTFVLDCNIQHYLSVQHNVLHFCLLNKKNYQTKGYTLIIK